eukprot:Protomagalhaensia_wolfi_Nauph_80__5736@NODE_693_length_2104_cov_215_831961_g517_i0_p1_GENE_NODE_693_length_2104_cov_215_831961_g517_i0NODE_693_length_2104_cov_215_831961_g517_i0_p1_ORF_typecomplete_len227_score32_28SieB/PF14163_6/1_3SieB/PF14163_6/2_1e02_NODE_693_length_2104_cov_215_831961_g517_i05581238
MRGCESRGTSVKVAPLAVACLSLWFDERSLQASSSFEELVESFPIDDVDGSGFGERWEKLEDLGPEEEERVNKECLEMLWELMVRRYLDRRRLADIKLQIALENRISELSENEKDMLKGIYEPSDTALSQCHNAAVSTEGSHTDVFLGMLAEDLFVCLGTNKASVTEWRVHPHLVNLIKDSYSGDLVKDLVKKSILQKQHYEEEEDRRRAERVRNGMATTYQWAHG